MDTECLKWLRVKHVSTSSHYAAEAETCSLDLPAITMSKTATLLCSVHCFAVT